MSTYGGINGHLVTSDDIYGITLLDATLVTSETGNYGLFGGYQLKCYFGASDCSLSAVFLQIKNDIPWTWISCEFELWGNAACWGFNGDVYGVSPTLGYLESYNELLGDIIPNQRCLNSWEKPQFQTHSKTTACDNEANNFFHGAFGTGNPKTFLMKRRKDTSGNYAGINHGRACKNAGSENYTIIKNIYIW